MRRRRKKAGTRLYMIMSILCLTILFAGYEVVYNLAEERKRNQNIAVVSIKDEEQVNKEKEQIKQEEEKIIKSNILDKIMSYFNIFLEKTFDDKKGSEDIKNKSDKVSDIKPTNEDDTQINIANQIVDDNLVKEVFMTIDSQEDTEGALEIYDDTTEKDDFKIAEKKVLLANNRKNDFFKVIESTSSRGSGNRNILIDAASINEKNNIVIFHTHGTEAFLELEDSKYRTTDENYNILGIGKQIASYLQRYGINAIHLKDYNDYPKYNLSYKNSNQSVKKVLSPNKRNIIVDIHRDGAEENSYYEEVLAKVKSIAIENKSAATCTLVIGEKNANYEELKSNAKVFFEIAEDLYPGLFRNIIIRPGAYFNQYISDDALLIEIGSTLNTIDEVKYSANLVSEILLAYIDEISK